MYVLTRSILILHRPFYLRSDSSQFIHVQERSYISYKFRSDPISLCNCVIHML